MRKLSVILILFAIFGISCEKVEGTGGKATITGKIYVFDYNSEGELRGEYYAPEEDIYIIYGDNEFYDDLLKTHYDGSFVFEYLYPGKYTLYAYSKCRTCPSDKEPVFKEVMITDNNEVIEIEDIIIEK